MHKPDSLRAALTAAIPDLRDSPERLAMFIDKGSLRATAVPGLSFEYRYKLQLLLLDFAGHPDQVMVPLLAWLFVHQNELLANHDRNKDGISFEAELLDKARVDLQITLALTERVKVTTQPDGSLRAEHLPEPPIEQGYLDETGAPIDTPVTSIVAAGVELLRLEDGQLVQTQICQH